ncbi:MAG: DUF1294 domain-containing protein [Methylophaga sp.]|nr:DUF1294 domain-containing protein [Methylophaga sp.]
MVRQAHHERGNEVHHERVDRTYKLISLGYITLSFIIFILYAVDKSAARNNKQRISERTLHLVALLGGWPGAMIAQKVFRHKTKKQAFRLIFWITVATNVSVVLFISTQSFPPI